MDRLDPFPCGAAAASNPVTRNMRLVERLTRGVPGATPDDYDVVLDGHAVGRIVLVQGADGERRWTWCLHRHPCADHDRGSASTLDDAKAALWTRAAAIWSINPWPMPGA